VITLEVTIQSHFPVGAGQCFRGEVRALVELERFEVRQYLTEPRVDPQVHIWGKSNENETSPFFTRQLYQTEIFFVNFTESVFTGYTRECAVGVISPRVVSAGESTCTAATIGQ